MADNEKTGNWFFFPKSKQLLTRPAFLFFKDYHRVIDHLVFLSSLAHSADKVSLRAAEYFVEYPQEDENIEKYKAIVENPKRAVKKLEEFSGMNSRNITNNVIDSFLWYLSAVIQLSMKKRPDLVRSKEQVRVDAILDFRNTKELLNYLVERKINTLSYGGIGGIEEFIEQRLGVQTFETDDVRSKMKLFIEIRNINAHNRGYPNRLFLDRIRGIHLFETPIEERVHLDAEKLILLTKACTSSVLALDLAVATKFGLRRKRYATWNKD